jgi:hypothetical protein
MMDIVDMAIQVGGGRECDLPSLQYPLSVVTPKLTLRKIRTEHKDSFEQPKS